MKRLSVIFILAVFLGIASCGHTQEKRASNKQSIENISNEAVTEVEPEYLTYDTFKEKVWDFEKNPEEWKYEGDIPCVIDFYAVWCRPCKMVAPIMDELAKKYEGKVKFYKIDTDKEKKLAGVFGIRSIPSVLFSPMKGKPMMQTGALQKDAYNKIIEEDLLNTKK